MPIIFELTAWNQTYVILKANNADLLWTSPKSVMFCSLIPSDHISVYVYHRFYTTISKIIRMAL